MSYTLNVKESGNALSVFTSYNFETVILAMMLVDKKTNNVIAVEKTNSLESVDTSEEDVSMSENDIISFIEIPNLDQGVYELKIFVMKALFLPTKLFKTCLNFDFQLEYVTLNGFSESSNQYEILSVYPSEVKKLPKNRNFHMEVKFNKPLDIDSMVSN